MSNIIIYIIRFIFLGLIFFESANLLGFLNFTLEYSWFGLVLTAGAVWLVLEFLKYFSKKKYNYSFPAIAFFIPSLNIVFDALGDMFMWYGKFVWYDQAMHFLGGAAIASVMFFILRGIFEKRNIILSVRFLGFVGFLIANFFGILYELEEYAESLFLHNNRLGDRFDTPNDLFFNMMGALTGTIIVILVVKIRKKS